MFAGIVAAVGRIESILPLGASVDAGDLIPHTVEVTTLRHVKAGDKVNLEVDMIARYVERMLSTSQGVHQD
ncbi:riboflavin synthase subunit alpha [Burkholderia lata]|uniref:Riboflavin synthase subunit alpha n=1 Tax=Burkholderia lata (strain ATCC 17760 / DSM 23089 / LMG 22485 / NCIMB 9086 / R18194 / 383) TaxID=482957 RepID=A0A6P2PAJ6_BURL3|nr:riboflavin synthase subunit alpha [Burkholderia lata]